MKVVDPETQKKNALRDRQERNKKVLRDLHDDEDDWEEIEDGDEGPVEDEYLNQELNRQWLNFERQKLRGTVIKLVVAHRILRPQDREGIVLRASFEDSVIYGDDT